MTSKELAATLNGREYRYEMTKDEEKSAKAAGLVVVFGASDDLMEFRGAINDEVGGDIEVSLDSEGILPDWDEVLVRSSKEETREYLRRDATARKIVASWESDGYSWTYTTDIPHETFDVMEDGEAYCRGIVFALTDLGRVQS